MTVHSLRFCVEWELHNSCISEDIEMCVRKVFSSLCLPLQLLPPERDVDGSELNCEPPSCYLHLHMDTTEYARLGVYSTDSAPGIIIAHGQSPLY